MENLPTLAETNPEIAKQWDYDKNEGEKPSEYSSGSNKKIWWICDRGHSYRSSIKSRCKGGTGCKFCAAKRAGKHSRKSIIENRPDLLQYWDYKKNKGVSPEDFKFTSRQKVWWTCNEGHSYKQAVADKISGSGCTICAKKQRAESVRLKKLIRTGSLLDNHPHIAGEWHPEKNVDLTPDQISSGSHIIIWWKCKHGHEWQASPNGRTDKRRQHGCPECHKSKTNINHRF